MRELTIYCPPPGALKPLRELLLHEAGGYTEVLGTGGWRDGKTDHVERVAIFTVLVEPYSDAERVIRLRAPELLLREGETEVLMTVRDVHAITVR